MSHSTTIPPSDISGISQNGGEDQNKENYNTELVQQDEIPNTPFKVTTIEGTGSFISLGNGRISKIMPTKKEAIDLLKKNMWEIIGTYIVAMIKFEGDIKNFNQPKTK